LPGAQRSLVLDRGEIEHETRLFGDRCRCRYWWNCRSPVEVKREFESASILRDGRVVFNIAGNKYRIVVWINYPYRVVYVRFMGTHAQYDGIDAQTI